MTNIDHDALEELLRHASPRPVPSQEDQAAAREAVREEWRNVASKRQTRLRVTRFAIAATVLIGVFAGLNAYRAPVAEAVQVATILKSIGPVYLLGEQAELRETDDLSNIVSGQTIVTGDDAGLALAWGNGGSLRIDENSRIEFTDDVSVFLEQGRVYFDSLPPSILTEVDTQDAPVFALHTEFGQIQHLGTQYMSEVDSGTLIVSVREGEVSVDGKFYDKRVLSGQQATISGRQQPNILSISRSGEAWNWVNRTTPPVDVEGKTLHAFLSWASRELGLELQYEPAAASEARKSVLVGTIDKEPAVAMPLWVASAGLDWQIHEGVIHIYRKP